MRLTFSLRSLLAAVALAAVLLAAVRAGVIASYHRYPNGSFAMPTTTSRVERVLVNVIAGNPPLLGEQPRSPSERSRRVTR